MDFKKEWLPLNFFTDKEGEAYYEDKVLVEEKKKEKKNKSGKKGTRPATNAPAPAEEKKEEEKKSKVIPLYVYYGKKSVKVVVHKEGSSDLSGKIC